MGLYVNYIDKTSNFYAFCFLSFIVGTKNCYWPVESGRFQISRPMSRASSSQNFEHPLPPLLVDFVRKMQLAMLRKFPEILAGKSARKF